MTPTGDGTAATIEGYPRWGKQHQEVRVTVVGHQRQAGMRGHAWRFVLVIVTMMLTSAFIVGVDGVAWAGHERSDVGKTLLFPQPEQRSPRPMVVMTTTGVTWDDVDLTDKGQQAFVRRAARSGVGNVLTARRGFLLCPTEGLTAVGSGTLGDVLPYEDYSEALQALTSATKQAGQLPNLEEVQHSAEQALEEQQALLDQTLPGRGQGCSRLDVDDTHDVTLLELQETMPGIIGIDSPRLGGILRSDRRSVVSIGPGAVVVSADVSGQVYGQVREAPTTDKALATAVERAASEADLTVVDADRRGANAREKLHRISAVIDALPESTQVIVVSVSPGYDARNSSVAAQTSKPLGVNTDARRAMQLAMISTDNTGTGFLRSGSLSRRGVITLADIAPTIVSSTTAVKPNTLQGTQVWTTNNGVGLISPIPEQAASTVRAIEDLQTRLDYLSDADHHFTVVSASYRLFFISLTVATVIIALVYLFLGPRRGRRRGRVDAGGAGAGPAGGSSGAGHGDKDGLAGGGDGVGRVRGGVSTVALPVTWLFATVALAPVASLLANLVPAPDYAQLATSAVVLVGRAWIVAAVCAVVVVWAAYAWHRHYVRRGGGAITLSVATAGLVSAVNVVMVVVFVLFGARLQPDALLLTPTLSTTRLIGISTAQLGILAVSTLYLVSALVGAYRVEHRLRWVIVPVVLAGAIVWIVGSPGLGSDIVGAVAIAGGATFLIVRQLLAASSPKRLSTVKLSGKIATHAVIVAGAAALTFILLVWANLSVPLQARSPLVKTLARWLASNEGARRPAYYLQDQFIWQTSVWSIITAAVCVVVLIVVLVADIIPASRAAKKAPAANTLKAVMGPQNVSVTTATIIVTILLAASINSEAPLTILTGALTLVATIAIFTWLRRFDDGLRQRCADREPTRRGGTGRRVAAVVAVVLVVGLSVTLMYADGANVARARAQDAVSATGDDDDSPVVLIVSEGLNWNAVPYASMPATRSAIAEGIAFNVVPLAIRPDGACPVDNWLAINAGRKVWDYSLGGMDLCTTIPQLQAGETVPLWDYYSRAQQKQTKSTKALGALGEMLKANKKDVAAIGPAASLAVADKDGVPYGSVLPAPADNEEYKAAVTSAVADNDFIVIDASVIPSSLNPARLEAATHRTKAEIVEAAKEQGVDMSGIPVNPSAITARLRPLDSPMETQPVAPGNKGDKGETSDKAADQPALAGDQDTPQSPVFPDLEPPQPMNQNLVDQMMATYVARQADRFEATVEAMPPKATVVAVSTMNLGMERAFNVGFIAGPGVRADHVRTGSVRQQDVIQLIDVTPTLVGLLDLNTEGAPTLMGGAITQTGTDSTQVASDSRIDELISASSQAQLSRSMRTDVLHSARTAFFYTMIGAIVLLAAGLWRPARRMVISYGPKAHTPMRLPVIAPGVIVAARWVALTVASLLFSSHVLRLVPWDWMANPSLGYTVFTWVGAGIIAAIAMVGPWRNVVWGPFVFVSALYSFFLTVDVAAGSPLIADAPLGYSTLQAARFYGAGNEVFSVFATATVVLLAFMTEMLYQRLSGATATVAVIAAIVVYGGFVVVVNGHPSMGADFGGPLALIPALIVLTVLVLRKRFSVKKAVGVGVVTVVVALAIAFADWMRPAADRTHLGRFMQSIIDGDLWSVVHGKLMLNLARLQAAGDRSILFMTLIWFVVVWLFVIRRPRGRFVVHPEETLRVNTWGMPVWKQWYWHVKQAWVRNYAWLAPRSHDKADRLTSRYPAVRHATISVLVLQVLAVGLNDSGINLSAIGALTVVPATVELLLHWVADRGLAADDSVDDA